jgi:hypothetical protein
VPFLRVLRDKRGYETTYLVHWFRDGNRQRSRILYVFRTPPGVRVGRDVLDPAVLREIEAQHPDIPFDWRALVENRQIIDNTPEQARRPRAGKGQGRPERPEARTPRKEPAEERPARVEEPRDVPPALVAADAIASDEELEGQEQEALSSEVEQPALGAAEGSASPVRPPRLVVPSALEGETRDDQLAFLARWYPQLRERVPHRTHDPLRRETLLALVERLNAAAWETEEQIAAGLVSASEALHRLSRVFSKRRRRSRRPKPSEPEPPPSNGSA